MYSGFFLQLICLSVSQFIPCFVSFTSELPSKVWHHDLCMSGVCVWLLSSPVSLTACRACELRFQAACFDLCSIRSFSVVTAEQLHESLEGRATRKGKRKNKKHLTRRAGFNEQVNQTFYTAGTCLTAKRTTDVINNSINCCIQLMFTRSRVLVSWCNPLQVGSQ